LTVHSDIPSKVDCNALYVISKSDLGDSHCGGGAPGCAEVFAVNAVFWARAISLNGTNSVCIARGAHEKVWALFAGGAALFALLEVGVSVET